MALYNVSHKMYTWNMYCVTPKLDLAYFGQMCPTCTKTKRLIPGDRTSKTNYIWVGVSIMKIPNVLKIYVFIIIKSPITKIVGLTTFYVQLTKPNLFLNDITQYIKSMIRFGMSERGICTCRSVH